MVFRYSLIVFSLLSVSGFSSIDAQVLVPVGIRSVASGSAAPNRSALAPHSSNNESARRDRDSTAMKSDESSPKGLVGAAVGATLGAVAGFLYVGATCDRPSCDVGTEMMRGAVVGGLIGFGLELLFRLPH
jgi:hypothetical protein